MTPHTTPADAYSLVALDMNGTTIHDEGTFETSLAHALSTVGAPVPSPADLAPLRGMAKSDMFRHLLADTAAAHQAYEEFTAAFIEAIDRRTVRPIATATHVLQQLQQLGLRTCLMTGFPRPLQRAILETLHWDTLVDHSVSSDDVARGRPHPDMIHHAAEATGIDDPRRIAVVGDTTNDLLAGHRARAGLIVGVLTGAHTAQQLTTVPNARIIPSIAHLPHLLEATAYQQD